MSEGTNQCPRQRRLAGAEVTFEENHGSRLQAGSQRRARSLRRRFVG